MTDSVRPIPPAPRPPRRVYALAAPAVAGLLAVGVAAPTIATDGSPAGPAPTTLPGPPPPFPGAQLIFADEFDAAPLDTTRWNTCHWWDDQGCTIVTNDELEWYLPEQVTLDGGYLHLVADRRAVDGTNGRHYDFVSGMVSSGPPVYLDPAKFAFTYGTVETRVRAPYGVGYWAAVWLLAASSYHLPEIDIVEILGADPAEMVMSFHPPEGTGDREQSSVRLSDEAFGDGWVTLRLDWAPGVLVWTVNGVESYRYEGDNVPQEPMYVIFNLAVGGVMPGPPAPETEFPATFLVDYVRVWQP